MVVDCRWYHLMRMMLITLVVMLAGCQQLPEIRSDSGFPTKPGTDNYRFLEKEYENLAPGVEFVLIKNSEQQREVFKKVFGKGWKRVQALHTGTKERKPVAYSYLTQRGDTNRKSLGMKLLIAFGDDSTEVWKDKEL